MAAVVGHRHLDHLRRGREAAGRRRDGELTGHLVAADEGGAVHAVAGHGRAAVDRVLDHRLRLGGDRGARVVHEADGDGAAGLLGAGDAAAGVLGVLVAAGRQGQGQGEGQREGRHGGDAGEGQGAHRDLQAGLRPPQDRCARGVPGSQIP
ncbi:MAG: hypothetical protein ACK559_21710, partial [bacterium]